MKTHEKLDRLSPEEAREVIEDESNGHLVAVCPACINDNCFEPTCEHWGAHIYHPDFCNTKCASQKEVGHCVTEIFRVNVGLASLEHQNDSFYDWWDDEEDSD